MVTCLKQVKLVKIVTLRFGKIQPKSQYLFACVIGDLAVLKDRYTTSEGRDVATCEKEIPNVISRWKH
jgi:aminopeptidase N